MNTLIIPCAGKSSRFPNMKPKYLLTYPDGKIMIQKVIENMNTDIYDRIIITIVKQHDAIFESKTILNQVFESNKKIELCILENFTKSPSETIYNTIKKMNINGCITIKDCDSIVRFKPCSGNFVVGYDINVHNNIENIQNKSFLVINEHNVIADIVEKKVTSNIICLGVYGFEDSKTFCNIFEYLDKQIKNKEMYISHIISYLIFRENIIFNCFFANYYEDCGTINEWIKIQKLHRTYFVDIDGVLIKNSGQYGSLRWDNNTNIIKENINKLIYLKQQGAQIILTTSRPNKYKKELIELFSNYNFYPDEIIMDLNHSTRVIINDFAKTNPYPSAIAISIPRNDFIDKYLDYNL